MIRIIAGGKKTTGAYQELISEYEKRLRKPFNIEWQFLSEEKLDIHLSKWPFKDNDFIICCDERGQIISSPNLSHKLEGAFTSGHNVVILIGGAYGFSDAVRERANFVWSFSRLVFPHLLSRLLVTEQIYRAQSIASGSPYHHQ
mgnify:CR=1 FL=1